MKPSLLITGSILVLLGFAFIILGLSMRDEVLPASQGLLQPGQWVFILFTSIGSILFLALFLVWLQHAG